MKLTTPRLCLESAEQGNIEKLNAVYEQAREYFSFEPKHTITPPQDCLDIGDLPPGGIRENFEIFKITAGGEIIGYITFYKGYPDAKTAYICFLYINDRESGYGTETVATMFTYLSEGGFEKIKLVVSFKNATAIRFWHKCGFTRLTTVDIKDDYAAIELEKTI